MAYRKAIKMFGVDFVLLWFKASLLAGRAQFWISEQEVRRYSDAVRMFFILAMGRSGTNFLAELLNNAQRAHVVHEPVKSDFAAYLFAKYDEKSAHAYVELFRQKDIYRRIRKLDAETYGEVNGVLRRHVRVMREVFPSATFIHLVRDGRDVVRSMMARDTLTYRDLATANLYPDPNDPYWRRWRTMSRFEKLCWYWQVENAHLRQTTDFSIQFEQIIHDYYYFSTGLLDPLKLDIPEEVWREKVTQPENATRKHTMPHWSEWGPDLVTSFDRLCGNEMRQCGYDYSWT